jgi:nitronate monooxygenase
MIQPSPQWNETRVSSRLGIEYPIIQGPLGGLSTQRLTAAVSNFGGLGSFGAHGLAPSAIKDVIAEIRAMTAKPFAINLWVSMEDEGARTSDREDFLRSLAAIRGHIQSLGGTLPSYRSYIPARFEDQVRAVLEAMVPVFSFICGIPPKEILDECRAQRILTIGTATTPDEAILLEQAGVEVIVASGFEAGGPRSQTPYRFPSLLPEVSPTPAASLRLSLWEPRVFRSARPFWHVKNPVRARFIVKRSSATRPAELL